MEPGLTRFESEQPKVKYIHVNVDERDKPENKDLLDLSLIHISEPTRP